MEEGTLQRLDAPAPVREALARLCRELQAAAGKNLRALVLFGGIAHGRFTPGRSDVNLVVVLEDASADKLAVIAPALQVAWRSIRLEPLLITPSEVHRAADVFPTKFLDIQAHQVVLAGESPFTGLTVSPEHVRLRVEQELRNLSLRLRRRYVSVLAEPEALSAILGELVGPLAVELTALLRLAGKPAPASDSPAAIFKAAATIPGLEALASLGELRGGATADQFTGVLDALARAAEVADGLKVS